jgi:type IV pilus assembly protein PilM
MGLPYLSNQAKKHDQIVAIDWGARTTKAVHLHRRGDRLSLLSYAIVDGLAEEKAPSVELLADHFKSVHRALGNGRCRQVALAVGVSDTLFRQVEVPLMPVGDLRLMLKYNSKTYLQQDLPDYVFDCCYLPGRSAKAAEGAKSAGPLKHRVFVGGAKRQTLEDLQAAIKAAGLLPEQIVPGLIGPVNAFELAEPEIFAQEIVALVDMGFKNSTIIILECGEIILNRVVAIGGDRLTAGLVDVLGTSYAEAEQIKLGMPGEVQQDLETVLHPLGRELRASIDFFENQHDKTVTQVFFSGGSARGEFVVQALQAELMVPCKAWNPVKTLHVALDPQRLGEIEQVAPQLTVAIGAATSAL